MTARKLDMFKQVLPAIDTFDKKFYSGLSDDQKKEFSPWIVMRGASSCQQNPEHYLIMVNDVVNANFSVLTGHPELQWMLLSICGVGTRQFHPFIKPPRKKGKNKIQEELSKIFPKLKADELELMEKIHSDAELVGIFTSAGYPDDAITEIF